MKTFFYTLLACLAIQSTQVHAIASPLGESLREYQAILDANTLIFEAIPSSESIFEIKRTTRNLAATTVYYEIKTVIFHDQHSHRYTIHEYRATLVLTPNEEIGPPVITVTSITPVHHCD